MRKVVLLLLAAVVVCGCIFTAGCVNEGAVVSPEPVVIPEPVYSVTVTTAGLDTYSTGEIFALQFLSNPSTGYSWYVTEGADLPIRELKSVLSQISVEVREELGMSSGEGAAIAGAPSRQMFWFQPDEAGDYTITLKYMRSWEGEDSAVSTYSQTVHVVDSDEVSVDGPKVQYSFDSFMINPVAGEYVKVIKSGNPSTGYCWTGLGDGLSIIEDFKSADDEVVGSSGQYEWFVTADVPGDYVFKAVYLRAGSDDELSYFEIPLKFV